MSLKAEDDLAGLTKKLRLLEEDYEHIQNQLQATNEKILELGKTSDENERLLKITSDVICIES